MVRYYITLHYKFLRWPKLKTSRTTGRNMPHKLQYNVRTRLPKQMSLQFSSEHQQGRRRCNVLRQNVPEPGAARQQQMNDHQQLQDATEGWPVQRRLTTGDGVAMWWDGVLLWCCPHAMTLCHFGHFNHFFFFFLWLTVGLASHRPCGIDNSGISIYGLMASQR